MDEKNATRIPLWSTGGIVAYALVDDADASLAGQRWHVTNGYAARSRRTGGRDAPQRTDYMHRIVAGLPYGDPRQVDHINHDRLDNRRSNLRVVTNAQNGQNRRSGYGVSKHRGVCWDKRKDKWMAKVELDGEIYFLGYFADEMEAAAVASAFRAKRMPFSEDAAR